jgi:hypothetical protein
LTLGEYSLGSHHSGPHNYKIPGGWVFHDCVCTCNVLLKYFFTLVLALAHLTTCFLLEERKGKKKNHQSVTGNTKKNYIIPVKYTSFHNILMDKN